MSYSCTVSFIKIDATKIFDFMKKMKRVCNERLELIAKENYAFCPFIRNAIHVNRNLADISSQERGEAKAWAYELFKWKAFYIEDLSLLGVVGAPSAVEDIFDGTVHFQDSTDQDYELENWGSIQAFEDIYQECMGRPDEEIKTIYQEYYRTGFDQMLLEENDVVDEKLIKNELDYQRRFLCYRKIWGIVSKYIANENDAVFFSMYGQYSVRQIYQFIKFCHEEQIKFEDLIFKKKLQTKSPRPKVINEKENRLEAQEIQKLENYRKYFGDIIFPDEHLERMDVYLSPANWMYSPDGRTWKQVPEAIEETDYHNMLFRRKPDGCIIGVTEDIRKNPWRYEYSRDNGNTWNDLCSDDYPAHNWIYHGNHNTVWFRLIQKNE